MFQAGKTAQIAAEMKTTTLALLVISEARWTQAGQKWLMSDRCCSILDTKQVMLYTLKGLHLCYQNQHREH